jgi:phenylacetate-CoA ligase
MLQPTAVPLAEGSLTRAELKRIKLTKLQHLLRTAIPANSFYTRKYANLANPQTVSSLEDFTARFPLVTKPEFVADQQETPPYGTNLSFPAHNYVRCHQTSGSTGATLRWPDTPASWAAMLQTWAAIFQAAGATREDRFFFAFSFGPFIGFWSAFESATRMGAFCFTAGAMNSEARLRSLLAHRCTVALCTPTYALHLGQEARSLGIDLSASSIRLIITAGEPGGSIPGVRARIANFWPGARVFDHHGMTESGPVTHECPARPCVLHVLESSFLAEIIDPVTLLPSPPGQQGELVLTTLDRLGSPLLRYRTGDLVRPDTSSVCACGRHELALVGGILGRADDMVIVRGVNVYPGAVDNIIRGFKGIAEYRVRLGRDTALAELSVEVESVPDLPNPEVLTQRLRCALHTGLGLRVPVALVPPGTLPRFEMKARRWERLQN